MKIFNALQVRELDQATISQEPISSIELMERAAQAFVLEFNKRFPDPQSINVICGLGNNGGDGLAIARLLAHCHQISCYILGDLQKLSPDAAINYQRLSLPVINLTEESQRFDTKQITIDAIFGTGLNRSLSGLQAKVIEHINEQNTYVVSVDIPSGMYTDSVPIAGDIAIEADLAITFQSPKLSFFLPEYAANIKSFATVDIGLHPKALASIATPYIYVQAAEMVNVYKTRDKFTHKGSYGHALLVAGSYGMMGAALLASKACVRAGAGKTTVYTAKCGYEILQTALPEAMVETDTSLSHLSEAMVLDQAYTCIGIGPGLGTHQDTATVLQSLLAAYHKPMVFDADALNIIAGNTKLLEMIPKGSVITPHPKEFDRLFGASNNHLERIHKAVERAKALQVTIVLKGAHTATVTAQGQVFINSTGNAGLAKGGSGDVLTGIITALMCQKYTPENAAILGVYLHGLCADLIVATHIQSMETLKASDLCDHLHLAFKEVISFQTHDTRIKNQDTRIKTQEARGKT